VFLGVVQPVHVQVANESSLLGPILVATGAVLAAVLTVFTANWRQAKQLRHDRELHKKQLDHDRELRQADLMYDRQMRHRARVQEVLDEALVQQARYWDAYRALEQALESAEGDLAPDEPISTDGATAVIEALDRIWDETAAAHDQSIRLVVRLGVATLVEAHTAIPSRTAEAVKSRNYKVVRTDEEKQAFIEASEKVEDAHVAFQVAVLGWNAVLAQTRQSKAAEDGG
jgi:hypothetical protein